MKYPEYLFCVLQHLICHYQVNTFRSKWQRIALNVQHIYLIYNPLQLVGELRPPSIATVVTLGWIAFTICKSVPYQRRYLQHC